MTSLSTNSPCAACKIQRRKCTQECVFAPYFPPDHPHKFACVHKVFGASNVSKLLNELNASQREDAVNSLYYEAEQRLLDPVYGCVGSICLLQHRLKQLDDDLKTARKELAHYIGPQAFIPMLQPPPSPLPPYNILSGQQQQQQQQHHAHHTLHMVGGGGSHAVPAPPGIIPVLGIPGMGPGSSGPPLRSSHYQQQQLQQQMFEAQQFVAATEQQQQELVRFSNTNRGYEAVTATGFNQITSNNGNGGSGGVSASLALGSFDNIAYNQIQPQVDNNSNQLPAQLLLLPQHQQQRSDSEEGKGLI